VLRESKVERGEDLTGLVLHMGLFGKLFKRERSLADLSKWLEVPQADLSAWRSGMPGWASGYDYTTFGIPKRSGGVRTIEAPTPKLKALQRTILHRLLNGLPVHPAAAGFVPGRSIVDNARPHVGQAVVVNIDLADFFPSVTHQRVEAFFRAIGWSAEASAVLANICTRDGHLPQGAPTSPALSNLANRKLDTRLDKLARKFGGHYTRYADDLTFSFPAYAAGTRKVLAHIRTIIEAEGYRIQMKKKVRVQRAHQRQTATGLVVNATVNAPRALRRKLRAMRHHAQTGRLPSSERARLQGWEAFIGMVKKQR
jgi:retron-type reverse transcriptase